MSNSRLVNSLQDLSSVGIWGFGREGKAAAKLATMARIESISIYDDSYATGNEANKPADNKYRFASDLSELEECQLVVRSPGASIYDERFVELSSRTATSSITQFWMEHYGSQTIAVTGTKGKSTTSVLTKMVLEACGLKAKVGGNLGFPLTELDEQANAKDASNDLDPNTWYVAEVSSFQASDLKSQPRYGIFTSFYPEHLDWHRTIENYRHDKANLFSQSKTTTIAASKYGAPEALTSEGVKYEHSKYKFANDQIFLSGDPEGKVANLTDTYLANEVSLTAVTLALEVVSRIVDIIPHYQEIEEVLRKFEGLAHRRQTVFTDGHISAIDDTLATNPQATITTLGSLEMQTLAVIVGGQDRGVDFSSLAEYLANRDKPTLAICVPDTGENIANLIEASTHKAELEIAKAQDIEDATTKGLVYLEKSGGGNLVLSPASPSFNKYPSYEHLSQRFVEHCKTNPHKT